MNARTKHSGRPGSHAGGRHRGRQRCRLVQRRGQPSADDEQRQLRQGSRRLGHQQRRDQLSIVKKGRGNTRAALLTQRRTGPAILNSRANVVRSAKAGQRYTVSAWVRTSQPARGRIVLRETSNGRAVKNSVKRFRAWKRLAQGHHERHHDACRHRAERPPAAQPSRQEEVPRRRRRLGPEVAPADAAPNTPHPCPTPVPARSAHASRTHGRTPEQRLRLSTHGHPRSLRRLPGQRLRLQHRPHALGERDGPDTSAYAAPTRAPRRSTRPSRSPRPTSPTTVFPGSASSCPTRGPTWPPARVTPGPGPRHQAEQARRPGVARVPPRARG